jgi:hypothetical protein
MARLGDIGTDIVSVIGLPEHRPTNGFGRSRTPNCTLVPLCPHRFWFGIDRLCFGEKRCGTADLDDTGG